MNKNINLAEKIISLTGLRFCSGSCRYDIKKLEELLDQHQSEVAERVRKKTIKKVDQDWVDFIGNSNVDPRKLTFNHEHKRTKPN